MGRDKQSNRSPIIESCRKRSKPASKNAQVAIVEPSVEGPPSNVVHISSDDNDCQFDDMPDMSRIDRTTESDEFSQELPEDSFSGARSTETPSDEILMMQNELRKQVLIPGFFN